MTTEDYVITLNMLHDEGVRPIPARLAEILDVSAPTVTQAVHRLERDGYVNWTDRRELELTPEGLTLARTLIRRHRLIERWLTDVLGLDWATADEEAHHLMHAISPIVEARLLQVMNYPTMCPHGNPITNVGGDRRPSIHLNELLPGTHTHLSRISELVEADRDMMRFYFEQGFRPGTAIEVVSAAGDGMEILLDGKPVRLTPAQGASLWVETEAAVAAT